MEQLNSVGINGLSSVNLNYFNKQAKAANNTQSVNSKQNGFSKEASDALKTQVLYQKQDSPLPNGLSKKKIISKLRNKKEMGRSFFGRKALIAQIITEAKDKDLATTNFNCLLDAKGKKMPAADIADVLLVATSINNGKVDKELAKEYGFEGGVLKEENIDSILAKVAEQKEQHAFEFAQNQMLQQQMLQQQILQDQILQQQMLQQQLLQQQAIDAHNQQMMLHQQAHHQSMSMSSGMGF